MHSAAVTKDASPDCEALCRAQYGRVLQLCRFLLSDRAEAEEIAQEVFLKLVRQWQTDVQVRSWEAWLTRVTVNACRDRQRSAWWKWWRKRSREFQELELPSTQLTPEQHALSREQQQHVWLRFRALSSRQREVFVLRRLEGLSSEEVATALGLSSGSVKRHLFLALRHLQKALGDLS
ncbi:MAG: sigma-70 family RNA polymerase sigma factor [Deltaproteobacteria bacterium]|nr:sigma-70 family RNA polymerase sigma factor [Deltaproteobacteria bacterium]